MTKIKPKEGLLVRDPVSKLRLPPEGKNVNLTSYWIRRLMSGDCELVDKPKSEKPLGQEK